jgi:hypothetical protein
VLKEQLQKAHSAAETILGKRELEALEVFVRAVRRR